MHEISNGFQHAPTCRFALQESWWWSLDHMLGVWDASNAPYGRDGATINLQIGGLSQGDFYVWWDVTLCVLHESG